MKNPSTPSSWAPLTGVRMMPEKPRPTPITRDRAAVADQVKLGRNYGACFELDDEAALQRYASHPAHDAWIKAYEKVRVPGTSTFDILGR